MSLCQIVTQWRCQEFESGGGGVRRREDGVRVHEIRMKSQKFDTARRNLGRGAVASPVPSSLYQM